MNILKPTELYTVTRWFSWHKNFRSKQLVKRTDTEHCRYLNSGQYMKIWCMTDTQVGRDSKMGERQRAKWGVRVEPPWDGLRGPDPSTQAWASRGLLNRWNHILSIWWSGGTAVTVVRSPEEPGSRARPGPWAKGRGTMAIPEPAHTSVTLSVMTTQGAHFRVLSGCRANLPTSFQDYTSRSGLSYMLLGGLSSSLLQEVNIFISHSTPKRTFHQHVNTHRPHTPRVDTSH